MEKQIIDVTSSLVSPHERTRIVRLCATLTGDRDAAEDLAQETLLEAWRCIHELREPEKQSQWLSGIARNVCLRWARKRGRDLAHITRLASVDPSSTQDMPTLEESIVDDFDIEVELERKELIELLDRAMALLPTETRAVLVKRYVEESPLAEVAAQLGTNTSAVAMRLQRGKLALRRVLMSEMRQEIAPYDTRISRSSEWEETPLWCYVCGKHRLLGRRKPSEGELHLKCPLCCSGVEDTISKSRVTVLKGVKGYRPLLSRLMVWCDSYYRTGLHNGTIVCEACGHIQSAAISLPQELPDWVREDLSGLLLRSDERVINTLCVFCRTYCVISLEGLVLSLPESRRFRQAYPRIRTLPRQYVEADGRAAIITSFESVTDNGRLDVVSAYDTYEVLRIYGGCR